MKNIFSSDVTEKYNSTLPSAGFYITAKTPDRLTQKLTAAKRELRDTAVKFLPATILKALTFACIIALGGLLGSTVLALGDYGNNLGRLLSENLWLPFSAVASVLGFIGFILLRKRLIARRKTGEDYKKSEEKLNTVQQSIRETLGVPDDTKPVDVLTKRFIVKNGKEKFTTAVTDFRCCEKRLFVKDDALCFADDSGVLTVPKADIICMRKYGKSASVLGWNKAVSPNEFDNCIVSAGKRRFKLNDFVVIELKHDDNDYELLFPPYELTTIRNAYDSIIGESSLS